MELISAIDDERIAARILAHLGLPTRGPPRGRPWRPQRELGFEPRTDDHDALDVPGAFE